MSASANKDNLAGVESDVLEKGGIDSGLTVTPNNEQRVQQIKEEIARYYETLLLFVSVSPFCSFKIGYLADLRLARSITGWPLLRRRGRVH